VRPRRATGAALVALALVAAACADDGDQSSDSDGTVTTEQRDRSGEAAYADPGPYAVGHTTVQLADRVVEVLYPAADAAGAPADIGGLEEGRQIYQDAPANEEGPFPVLLYSHGFAGSPLVSANLQAGIASWGFVVAAPDHIERNTAAVLGRGDADPDAARDVQTMQATLVGVVEAGDGDGPLAGAVDGDRVASAGHSAGGGAALNALRLPEVTATVTWAGVHPTDEALPDEPVLVLGAEADIAVTGDEQREVYEGLTGPKRLVQLDGGAGHATFLDLCPGARREVIESGVPRPAETGILALAFDGCDADDVDPIEAWRVIQHFTVAHVRDALGIDEEPVGLGDEVLDEFPDVPVRYEHAP
jgi:predicted dienelactone hydrolase